MTRAGIGRTFQVSSVFPLLLGARERAPVGGGCDGRHDEDLAAAAPLRDAVARADLGNRAGRAHRAAWWPAGLLSHGDKRKLELAMLLAAEKRVILLDEPMAGISMEEVTELVELIRSVHADEGKTVSSVEHHMEVVIGLAQRIAVLHGGAPARRRRAEAIMANETVQTAYLGRAL